MVFGFGKKNKVVDLGEKFRRQQEKLKEMREDTNSSYGSSASSTPSSTTSDPVSDGFGFLGSMAGAASTDSSSDSSSNEGYVDMSSTSDAEERKRKLAKRLMAITDKLEDISNQIYHLQQRIEVVEKKMAVGVGL